MWGKLLGGFFGYMLAHHFIGALIGIWLGHKLDKALGQSGRFRETLIGAARQSALRQQQLFFHATFSVMGHIAKSKGRVTAAEIGVASLLMDRLNLDATHKQAAQEAFRQGKESEFPLEETLKTFVASCRGRKNVLQMFLEIQLQAAFADGELHPNEKDVLDKVADILGFSQAELARLISMLEAELKFHRQGRGSSKEQRAQQLTDAYQILGVTEQDSFAVVKKAYRKLMSQHHPDKLVAKGLPPEMMEVAKEKAQDIQKAYELIKQVKETE
ncbi:co-chaperone DjlA [Motilimonas cestriensis]|uniref:Co-chaperone protein DjlA n=1 Tax=Motilimonas cestriensis TaxID=2742685 RepID=A0ABS8W868_9GAMM|nr:co-chaperone DjlA [Motilimonas cestriensis]MCE2595184.1 co-chaperone DjlA [Motilimonas cestriensis]